MDQKILNFYKREDVQNEILKVCKDREVAVRYNSFFGRRPDVMVVPGDIIDAAKKGASSFHISEERWSNPLDIVTGMNKRELDDLRIGWDLVLDIDTSYWNYAKLTAYYLIEAIKFHGVKNISCKFSGNKGFHIVVPFEAFPDQVNGVLIKNLFPEALRVMAEYLQNMIKDHLIASMLSKNNIDEIVEMTGIKKEDLMKDGKFDPFTIIDIDTILISSRHLFRSPYSAHEKSGLISIPIHPDTILQFEKHMAEIENVRTDIPFLDREAVEKGEATHLIVQSFDWHTQNTKTYDAPTVVVKKEFETPKDAIAKEFFPPCINKILEARFEDGRKRALFILVNFLLSVGWSGEQVKQELINWNNRLPESLREGYLLSQIQWHLRQNKTILPPNCDKKEYYQDLFFCDKTNNCNSKNPVNYAMRRYFISKKKKKRIIKKK